ncbi:hypothetical protein [Polaribacter sp.]|uniref:hypothetical protein n=1 Tax=Polaribacter sp. TaxID=1920175 RepID=UPI003F6D6005
MKKVPFKSIIIIIVILTSIWTPALLDEISMKNSLIITISVFIGSFAGYFILEKGKKKSS